MLGFETSCITIWRRKTKWNYVLKTLDWPKLHVGPLDVGNYVLVGSSNIIVGIPRNWSPSNNFLHQGGLHAK